MGRKKKESTPLLASGSSGQGSSGCGERAGSYTTPAPPSSDADKAAVGIDVDDQCHDQDEAGTRREQGDVEAPEMAAGDSVAVTVGGDGAGGAGEAGSADDDRPTCRICLDPASDSAPLEDLECMCKGGSKYVHRTCGDRWWGGAGRRTLVRVRRREMDGDEEENVEDDDDDETLRVGGICEMCLCTAFIVSDGYEPPERDQQTSLTASGAASMGDDAGLEAVRMIRAAAGERARGRGGARGRGRLRGRIGSDDDVESHEGGSRNGWHAEQVVLLADLIVIFQFILYRSLNATWPRFKQCEPAVLLTWSFSIGIVTYPRRFILRNFPLLLTEGGLLLLTCIAVVVITWPSVHELISTW